MKKHSEKILSPLLVMLILGVVFYAFELFPFGTKALYWGDMSQQNFPVMLQLKDILNGNSGTFFSMANAGGMDFSGVFLFLASSPFSFLSAFISKENLIFYLNIMIVLKLMTSSFTASLFFSKFFKTLTKAQIISLSVAYALCGYSMMFYQLHTWLDVMYMFPLLLIAFSKLIKQDKFAPYTIVLSIMILFQFYLGYMLAIFIILSFAIYILIVAKSKDKKRNIYFFAIGTFLSILICAPILLTAYEQYLGSARGVSIIESISMGEFFTQFTTTIPFIFCTIILLAVFFLTKLKFFKNKRFLALFIIYILMLIPIIIEPINKMWHTGSYQAFPVRYGYITVLIGLSIGAYIIAESNKTNASNISRKSKIASIILSLLIVEFLMFACWYVIKYGEVLKNYSTTLWGSENSYALLIFYAIISVIIMLILFTVFKRGKITKTLFSVLLCIFIVGEGLFNSSVYVGYGARDTSYYHEVISLSDKIDDDSVFRVKAKHKYFDVNLMGAMGYNSLAHYTSLIDNEYIYAMKKLGFSSYWMEVNSNGSTAFIDALLGNKYTISSLAHLESFQDVVYSGKRLYISENNLNLSLGTVIPTITTEKLSTLETRDRIELQNYLYKNLVGTKTDLITRYDYDKTLGVDITKSYGKTQYDVTTANSGTIKYSVYVKGNQRLYFDAFDELSTNLNEPNYNTFSIVVNNKTVMKKYPKSNTNGIIDLGEFQDEKVDISISVSRDGDASSFGVFGMDLTELEKGLETINQANVKINGNSITVNANSNSNDNSLLLTIPYNKGFTVTVNGKKVEPSQTLDTFMAIPLEKGKNTVKLSYLPYGLGTGIIIALIGIILLVILSLFYRKHKHKEIIWLENILLYGFLIIAGLVLIAIYIFPLIIKLK